MIIAVNGKAYGVSDNFAHGRLGCSGDDLPEDTAFWRLVVGQWQCSGCGTIKPKDANADKCGCELMKDGTECNS